MHPAGLTGTGGETPLGSSVTPVYCDRCQPGGGMPDRRERYEYERQLGTLRGHVHSLEVEVSVLRRRLHDAPRRARLLE